MYQYSVPNYILRRLSIEGKPFSFFNYCPMMSRRRRQNGLILPDTNNMDNDSDHFVDSILNFQTRFPVIINVSSTSPTRPLPTFYSSFADFSSPSSNSLFPEAVLIPHSKININFQFNVNEGRIPGQPKWIVMAPSFPEHFWNKTTVISASITSRLIQSPFPAGLTLKYSTRGSIIWQYVSRTELMNPFLLKSYQIIWKCIVHHRLAVGCLMYTLGANIVLKQHTRSCSSVNRNRTANRAKISKKLC